MPESNTLVKPKQLGEVPGRIPVQADKRGVKFTSFDEMYRFCVGVCNSKEFKDIDSPEQAMIRLQAGLEIGLTPIWSLTNVMVVNGRPSVWGDALLGLVLAHPDCEDVIETIENEDTNEETAVCEVRRKGRVPVIRKFSMADVKKARLDTKNQSVHGFYPRRMRQMRARSWACRDAFADALRGLGVVEEMREAVVIEREERKALERKPMILPDEVLPPVSESTNSNVVAGSCPAFTPTQETLPTEKYSAKNPEAELPL